MAEPVEQLERAVRESGLVREGSSGVVLISGGADSACAAAGIAAVAGPEQTLAVTCNYGLRETAERDERVCRELCNRLELELVVERPDLGSEPGNLQAAARDARYAIAERLRAQRGLDFIATGHTLTDQAETLIYRLATSPGRRALLGLDPRRDRIIRPLLSLTREETRAAALAAGLPFADDETNDDPRFARNRIRSEVLPALRDLNPAAIANIAETRSELAEEAALLARLADDALASAGVAPSVAAIDAAKLVAMDPALARLALRALAERAQGDAVAMPRARAADVLRLAADPEGGQVDLGAGLSARVESGFVILGAAEPRATPEPVRLPVPGRARFGDWEVVARVAAAGDVSTGRDRATLDAAKLGTELEVRSWREGDQMRPLGMSGHKSLQDLFTDRRVQRSLRRRIPVVVSGGEIAWVAGVAISEDFKLTPGSAEAAELAATMPGTTTLS